MKQIPESELDDFKKNYFADFFCMFSYIDLKKYFYPFYNDEYCIQPKNKIGYWLWNQYKEILNRTDMDKTEDFTNLLFDRFSGNEEFIEFLYDYKKYFKGWEGLKGDDSMNFYKDYEHKSMAIYTSSTFRFNQEEVLQHFCFWLKKEGVLNRITIYGETEKQRKICKSYVDHYFNRQLISSLPRSKLMLLNEWFTSVDTFFRGK